MFIPIIKCKSKAIGVCVCVCVLGITEPMVLSITCYADPLNPSDREVDLHGVAPHADIHYPPSCSAYAGRREISAYEPLHDWTSGTPHHWPLPTSSTTTRNLLLVLSTGLTPDNHWTLEKILAGPMSTWPG